MAAARILSASQAGVVDARDEGGLADVEMMGHAATELLAKGGFERREDCHIGWLQLVR
jgi:hypothetical protein